MLTDSLTKPSLTLRIGIGKFLGFTIGLAGFLLLPVLYENADWSLRWGILFWYTTLGAIIGVFGVYARHPVLNLPLPWWVRSPMIGAWMNFVLTLFVYRDFQAIMIAITGQSGAITSPYWFVLEGAIVGLIIGFMATKFAGEGSKTVTH